MRDKGKWVVPVLKKGWIAKETAGDGNDDGNDKPNEHPGKMPRS